MFRVSKRIEVAGAHWLDLPYDSACKNMHGHNWIIVVTVQAEELDCTGMVIDFKSLKEIVHKLDHQCINDVVGAEEIINPTAENIAKWIAEEVDNHLSFSNSSARVEQVEVQESEGNKAWYIP
ncbi:MAG: 6-carboxytetrahydropterin synthase QueD [Thermoplasmata archaeon]|nr:MAG: 6-carboxytetrahydropterin synthase QueD [Thermoplasmata archaeon]